MIVLAQLGADHPNRRTSDQPGARGHGYAVTLRCLGSERAVVAGRGVTVQSADARIARLRLRTSPVGKT